MLNNKIANEILTINKIIEEYHFQNIGIIKNEIPLAIWPQPAKNSVWIQFPSDGPALSKIDLYDLQGRLIKHFGTQNGLQIKLESGDIKAGIYLLTVTRGNQLWQQKIIFSKKD